MAKELANSNNVQVPTPDPNKNSVEATIESGVDFGATESTCNNNNNNAESSLVNSDGDFEKSLEYADELMVRGSKAAQERDYAEATECYSRALEVRVAHYGELAPECIQSYYKYGCALLYKAQEEADPLAAMPKKEGVSQEDSNVDGSISSTINSESPAALVSNNDEQGGSSNNLDEDAVNAMDRKDEEEGEEESDDEDLADGGEDESDLDLAWKMLDIARAIVEKHSGDMMEKVDILSALAEVALEREDVETSLSDYLKALSILERLVEPDSRLIAELNFRISLCLEIGSKPEEAIPYCQKAISVCKSRVQRLMNEVKKLSGLAETPAASESSQTIQLSSNMSSDSLADKEAEIETLAGLSGELEKKLEDLHQLVSNPTSILSDILGMVSAKARGAEKNALSIASGTSQMGIANIGGAIESTVSTEHADGAATVTHLGVVGRGVKRVVMNSGTEESGASKKPCVDPSPNNGDGSAS